jgi:hypothetical protein
MENFRDFFSKIEKNTTLNDLNTNLLIKILCNSLLSVVNDFESNSNGLNYSKNFLFKVTDDKSDIFEVDKTPKLDIVSYMIRICQFATPDNSTVILTFILVDKILNTGKIALKTNNIHK